MRRSHLELCSYDGLEPIMSAWGGRTLGIALQTATTIGQQHAQDSLLKLPPFLAQEELEEAKGMGLSVSRCHVGNDTIYPNRFQEEW
jgi:hypothetical protein